MGQDGHHGLIVRLTVSPGRFEARGQMYARSMCDTPVIGSTYSARLQAARGGPEQVRLDLMFESATMTIDAEDVAAFYEKGGNCGLKGWRRGVPMPVAGRTCDPLAFPAPGARVEQTAHVSGDRLTIGQLHFFAYANARPGVILPTDLKFRRERK